MNRLLPFATLVVTGAAWGATQPLMKLAVSEGYRHFGLIFWQTVLVGLLLGLGGVALLVLPEASLPAGTQAVWIAVALISSACYALEGNMVSKWGTQGMDAVQVLAGASILGVVLSLPLALASGQFITPALPLTGPDKAVIASAILHGFAYSAYVWLVGRAGAVFAAQVSYLVTLFGICWAMLFLGEGYSGWVWVALALMMAGMALVQPQRKPLVPVSPSGQNAVG